MSRASSKGVLRLCFFALWQCVVQGAALQTLRTGEASHLFSLPRGPAFESRTLAPCSPPCGVQEPSYRVWAGAPAVGERPPRGWWGFSCLKEGGPLWRKASSMAMTHCREEQCNTHPAVLRRPETWQLHTPKVIFKVDLFTLLS